MKLSQLSTLIVGVVLWVSIASPTFASSETHSLRSAPDLHDNKNALQRGAKLFINYCLNCHSAKAVRYNTLLKLGFSEEDVRDNLLFTGKDIGDLMKTAMRAEDAKQWFGVVPPDLSLETRARSGPAGSGADWVYTYLLSFYRDKESATGWNNLLFPRVAMPHIFWEIQGEQHLEDKKMVLKTPGLSNPEEFKTQMAELVAFMDWMSEPYRSERKTLGIYVLLFFAAMTIIAYFLKREFWKDIR